ncbi:MAG: AraC family transcriptional regulator [Cellvibrionaceae bacterium]|nr:AraC family transcriptional regulator [Cellvibrionaceae bacterium]MCV6627909.1 AraC family transcriptional regulator [Cellvibrionaceae bacterium]
MAQAHFPASYAAIMAEMVEEYGKSAEALLKTAGLSHSQIDQPEARINDAQFRLLLNTAVQISGDPAIGLRFGRRLTLTSHGVLGYALMSCKDLLQALDLLAKYYRLLMNSSMLQLEQDEQFVTIEHRDFGVKLAGTHFDEEVFSAGMVTALKQLLHRETLPIEVYFSYPEPAHRAVYLEVFDHPPQFGHHHNVIRIPNALLQEKPEFANPSMLKIYQQQCDRLMARIDDKSNLSASVRRQLITEQGEFSKLDDMAAQFHMSPRTFRRRLQEEGKSFQKISDEVKRELAEDYLRNSAFSIETVANLVGFNDISNFRRAFIRWTGQSPAAYQKQLNQS